MQKNNLHGNEKQIQVSSEQPERSIVKMLCGATPIPINNLIFGVLLLMFALFIVIICIDKSFAMPALQIIAPVICTIVGYMAGSSKG